MSAKRKIWLCTSTYGVGSEVWMQRQAMGIQAFETHVVTNKVANAVFPESKVPIHVFEHPQMGSLSRAFNRTLDILTGCYPSSRAEMAWLNDLAKQHQPTLLFCHFGASAVQMLPFLKANGVPAVCQFNGHDLSSSLRDSSYRKMLEKTVPHLSGYVVLAQYMHDWLVSAGADPSRIRRIPLGAPIATLRPVDSVERQPCRFIACGRMVDKKCPDLTIKAFGICFEKFPDSELVMVGDGPMMEQCRTVVEEISQSHPDFRSAVKFLGFITAAQLSEEMAKSSVFVQHSVTPESGNKEGWPVAIGEALACGLPVVSTNHASIPEQVEHGKSGLIVEEFDWQGMGGAMMDLAGKPEVRSQMSRHARSTMLELDTQNQIAKLESFMESVLSQE